MDVTYAPVLVVVLVMMLVPALTAAIWGRVDTYKDPRDRYW